MREREREREGRDSDDCGIVRLNELHAAAFIQTGQHQNYFCLFSNLDSGIPAARAALYQPF